MKGWGSGAVLALLVFGCARNLAPPDDIALRYEGPIQSRDIVEGGRIYMTLCAACHRGRVNPRGYSWSAGQMRHQIREGNRLMPPLSDELLSDEQVEAVLAYLVVMGALEGELPPATRGDELDLDEVADEDLDAEEPELVGASESPELPAAEAPPTEPQPAPAAASAGAGAGGAATTPANAPGPPAATEGGVEEGARGLAPPSGSATDESAAPEGNGENASPPEGSEPPEHAEAGAASAPPD